MNEDFAKYQKQLKQYMAQFSREKSVAYSLSLLAERKVTVSELYEEIIRPVLASIIICRADEGQAIWKEHLMTSIVRSIVESAHSYVEAEREANWEGAPCGKVIVLCPEEEYHEIGARMGADFFTITGFDVYFIGANTPKSNLVSAYETLKPDLIAFSVANYLNLVSVKKYIEEIREKIGSGVKITLSGGAFSLTGKTAGDFGADALIQTFADVMALRGICE